MHSVHCSVCPVYKLPTWQNWGKLQVKLEFSIQNWGKLQVKLEFCQVGNWHLHWVLGCTGFWAIQKKKCHAIVSDPWIQFEPNSFCPCWSTSLPLKYWISQSAMDDTSAIKTSYLSPCNVSVLFQARGEGCHAKRSRMSWVVVIPKEDGRAWSRPSFFWYDTDFLDYFWETNLTVFIP